MSAITSTVPRIPVMPMHIVAPRIYSAFRGPKHVRVKLPDKRRRPWTDALAEFFRTPAPSYWTTSSARGSTSRATKTRASPVRHPAQRGATKRRNNPERWRHRPRPLLSRQLREDYLRARGRYRRGLRSRPQHPIRDLRLFARHVLDHEVQAEAVPLRNYDLAVCPPSGSSRSPIRRSLRYASRRSATGLGTGGADSA